MKTTYELTQEAHEIICNINAAARNMEITAQQRDELIRLVMQDVNEKTTLARELLQAWRRDDMSSETIAA